MMRDRSKIKGPRNKYLFEQKEKLFENRGAIAPLGAGNPKVRPSVATFRGINKTHVDVRESEEVPTSKAGSN